MKETIKKIPSKIITPFIDLVLGRTMSKKLTVFIVATVALWQDLISGTEWSIFAGVYVFGLLWLNHLEAMAKAKKEINDFRGADQIKVMPDSDINYDSGE